MTSNENLISEIERVLQDVFPDKWDCDETSNSDIIKFYIHFPHILITNSEDDEHDILDLYVKLEVYHSGRLKDVYGNRATYNQAEYESNYSHSHLSTTVARDGSWGGFCMGSEAIVTDIAELQTTSIVENHNHPIVNGTCSVVLGHTHSIILP